MKLTINKLEKDLIKYTITFPNLCVELLNLGATIYDIKNFDRFNRLSSIVLKYDKPQDYKNNLMYLGTTTGPYAGRIANGQYTHNDHTYTLPINDGPHHLHGGPRGLSTKFFDVKIISANEEEILLEFSTTITTLDDNLPGELLVKILYTITNENINIKYEAQSSENGRVVNITNHTYWNLSGDLRHNITDMLISGNTTHVWSCDENQIPNERLEVTDLLDFSTTTSLRDILRNPILQLKDQKGLDNAFEIADNKITLSQRTSGRSVTISSDQNTVVIYTQNFGSNVPVNNWPSRSTNLGIACEFQAVPNDINHDSNASSFIAKGQIWTREINFKFNTTHTNIFKKIFDKSQK